MKKNHLVIAASLILLAVGCSKSSLPPASNLTPQQVADEYLDAAIHSDFEGAYQHISDKDKLKVTREMFVSENQRIKGNYPTRDLMQRIVYKTDEAYVKGNTAAVPVNMRLPILICNSTATIVTARTAVNTAARKDYEQALSQANQYSRQTYKDCIGGGGLFTLEQISLNLIKEPGGWKVSLNIEGQDLADRKADEIITQLVDTAVQLKQTDDERRTQERLNEIKRLESRADQTTNVRNDKVRQRDIAMEYIAKVELRDTGVSLTHEGAGIFYGELINHGTATLKDVEITIHGLDEASDRLFTIKHHPLIMAAGITQKYLMPGQSRQISYNLTSTPKKWNGAIDARITDLSLAND